MLLRQRRVHAAAPACALAAGLLSLLGGACLADDGATFLFPTLAPKVEEQLDRRWAARLQDLGTRAHAGEWREVARAAEALGEGLARARHRDPRPFGMVAAYRALAAAALGEERDAVWHWQVALNLLPDIDRAELVRGFEIAPTLLPVELPPRHANQPELDSAPHADHRPPAIDPRSMVRLGFLAGPFASSGGAPPALSVELIIGADGRHHSPRLLTSAQEQGAQAYSALEALRRWRYEPARVNGEPVDSRNRVDLGTGKPPSGSRWRRF